MAPEKWVEGETAQHMINKTVLGTPGFPLAPL